MDLLRLGLERGRTARQAGCVTESAQDAERALARLRAALDTWLVETGDLGQWPEPPEVVAPFEKEMHDWFGTPAWYAKP